ncbi:MAG: hypothetical protein KAX80_10860 [Planctomycetes bacterium]|nr:hypothetical protein [Planctomycetota bacterium]
MTKRKMLAKDKKMDSVRLTPQEDRQMELLARWFQDHRVDWWRFVGEERAVRLGIDLNDKPSRQSLWIIGLDQVASAVRAFRRRTIPRIAPKLPPAE